MQLVVDICGLVFALGIPVRVQHFSDMFLLHDERVILKSVRSIDYHFDRVARSLCALPSEYSTE